MGLAPLVTHLKVRVTSDCEQGEVERVLGGTGFIGHPP